MARLLILSYEFAPFRGGIASVAEGLATGAAESGHDVHVLAPDYHADRTAVDSVLPFTVHRFSGDFCSVLSVGKLARFARLIRRTIDRLRPDAVHAADPQSHMALAALGQLGVGHGYGVTVHGSELLKYRGRTVPRIWMRNAFAKAAFIAPVSEATRQLLLSRPDVDPDRMAVIYPGISRRWLERPPAHRATTREAWGFAEDDLVLVTVARRVSDKGQLRVIEALSQLAGSLRRRCAYVVIGTGPAEYAQQLVRAAEAGSVRLHLAGGLDDDCGIDVIDAAEMFVMLSESTPARLEGLGLAYIEAAARGLPALARATGGVAEAVAAELTGCVLSEDSGAAAATAALEQLLTDDERRTRLGKAARDHAQSFTWRRYADTLIGRLL